MAGAATATANSTTLNAGPAAANATATGGSPGFDFMGNGGDATATANSTAAGYGAASAAATATGGSADFGPEGAATATVNSTAAGYGAASAVATATGGSTDSGALGAANASSTAITDHGAIAQAQSTAVGSSGEAQSTAATGFTTSTATAPTGGTATTNAIAQAGGSGQTFDNPGETAYAFTVGDPSKIYTTALIGTSSQVANALLGPNDVIFGAAILGANYASDGGGESDIYTATSTIDLVYGGDLMLGLIDEQQSGFTGGAGFEIDRIHRFRQWRHDPGQELYQPHGRRQLFPGSGH